MTAPALLFAYWWAALALAVALGLDERFP